jgi:hypothetical protein
MNTMQETVEAGENGGNVGRITPLNMTEETNGFDCDTLVRDLGTASESECYLNWA